LEDSAAKRPIIAHELNALASYVSDHCDFPEEINSDDISFSQIAEAVMQSWSPGFHTSGSLDGFRAWKRVLLMRSQDLRTNLSARTQGRNSALRQKIRVAYAQGAAGFAGAEEALSRLIGHLDRDMISPHAIVSAPGWFSERLHSAGAQVTVANQDIGSPSESALDCILGIFQKLEPDIVHLNTCKDRTIALAATLLNIPVVMHARVHEQLYNGHALGLASSVIAISSLTKRTLQRLLVDPKLVSIIYDGVDLDHFDVHEVVPFSKHELGINNDFHIILMIARYVPYKRHDLMLDALELLLQRVPNVCLVLVGDVFREEEALLQLAVKEQIEARRLREHVLMIGFQHDIRRIEASATALVLCSDGEPFGICVTEAMALGIPAIVTDSCGAAEIIEHGVDGYIVPSGSPAAITAAFEQILAADKSMAMSHASRSTVAGKLSLSDAASRIVTVYQNILRERGGK
jgi:glycosyltransferase involved in cell wall biosynthesis